MSDWSNLSDKDYEAGAAMRSRDPAPIPPDGWILVPRALTAENGAKAALIGDFSETFDYIDDEGDGCTAVIPVSWDTIKSIHKAMVAHFDDAPVPSSTASTAVSATLKKALTAIAEGYPTTGIEDRYISVENPDFQPDNGSNPNLVIDLEAVYAAPPSTDTVREQIKKVMLDNAVFAGSFGTQSNARLIAEHLSEKIAALSSAPVAPAAPVAGTREWQPDLVELCAKVVDAAYQEMRLATYIAPDTISELARRIRGLKGNAHPRDERVPPAQEVAK